MNEQRLNDVFFVIIYAIFFGLSVSMILIGGLDPIAHAIWCVSASLNGSFASITILRLGRI